VTLAERGHWKLRPEHLYADRVYDSNKHRATLKTRGITPKIPRRGTAQKPTTHGSGLGTCRWQVERNLVWLHNDNRCVAVRYEHRADIHEAFLTIGYAVI